MLKGGKPNSMLDKKCTSNAEILIRDAHARLEDIRILKELQHNLSKDSSGEIFRALLSEQKSRLFTLKGIIIKRSDTMIDCGNSYSYIMLQLEIIGTELKVSIMLKQDIFNNCFEKIKLGFCIIFTSLALCINKCQMRGGKSSPGMLRLMTVNDSEIRILGPPLNLSGSRSIQRNSSVQSEEKAVVNNLIKFSGIEILERILNNRFSEVHIGSFRDILSFPLPALLKIAVESEDDVILYKQDDFKNIKGRKCVILGRVAGYEVIL